MKRRRRKKGRRNGFLASLAEPEKPSYPLVECEPIPVKAEILGKIGELSIPRDPVQGFSLQTTGEGNYRDNRLFNIQETAEGGWVMAASWQAQGDGPPPFFLQLLGSMAPLFSKLFDFGLRRSHPIVHQIGHSPE